MWTDKFSYYAGMCLSFIIAFFIALATLIILFCATIKAYFSGSPSEPTLPVYVVEETFTFQAPSSGRPSEPTLPYVNNTTQSSKIYPDDDPNHLFEQAPRWPGQAKPARPTPSRLGPGTCFSEKTNECLTAQVRRNPHLEKHPQIR